MQKHKKPTPPRRGNGTRSCSISPQTRPIIQTIILLARQAPVPFSMVSSISTNSQYLYVLSSHPEGCLPCYNTAKHLASLLQPIVGQSRHHINKSKHFVDTISNTSIQSTDTLVTFDVEPLLMFEEVIPVAACRKKLNRDYKCDKVIECQRCNIKQ